MITAETEIVYFDGSVLIGLNRPIREGGNPCLTLIRTFQHRAIGSEYQVTQGDVDSAVVLEFKEKESIDVLVEQLLELRSEFK